MPAELGTELAIEPLDGPVDATVDLPGSKSITNRALVCAALGRGRSTLDGALRADDTEAMVDCLRALGVGVDADWATTTVSVDGQAGGCRAGDMDLDARMSGTTARFVLPLLGLARGAVRARRPPGAAGPADGPDAIAALRSLGVATSRNWASRPPPRRRPRHRLDRRAGRSMSPATSRASSSRGCCSPGRLMATGCEVELTTGPRLRARTST